MHLQSKNRLIKILYSLTNVEWKSKANESKHLENTNYQMFIIQLFKLGMPVLKRHWLISNSGYVNLKDIIPKKINQ